MMKFTEAVDQINGTENKVMLRKAWLPEKPGVLPMLEKYALKLNEENNLVNVENEVVNLKTEDYIADDWMVAQIIEIGANAKKEEDNQDDEIFDEMVDEVKDIFQRMGELEVSMGRKLFYVGLHKVLSMRFEDEELFSVDGENECDCPVCRLKRAQNRDEAMKVVAEAKERAIQRLVEETGIPAEFARKVAESAKEEMDEATEAFLKEVGITE